MGRLGHCLAAAQAALVAAPEPLPPGARQIGYAIFRRALDFVDAMNRGEAGAGDLTVPEALVEGAEVARYGALARGRIDGWFDGAGPRELRRLIGGAGGPMTGTERLARLADATAQGLADLLAALEPRSSAEASNASLGPVDCEVGRLTAKLSPYRSQLTLRTGPSFSLTGASRSWRQGGPAPQGDRFGRRRTLPCRGRKRRRATSCARGRAFPHRHHVLGKAPDGMGTDI